MYSHTPAWVFSFPCVVPCDSWVYRWCDWLRSACSVSLLPHADFYFSPSPQSSACCLSAFPHEQWYHFVPVLIQSSTFMVTCFPVWILIKHGPSFHCQGCDFGCVGGGRYGGGGGGGQCWLWSVAVSMNGIRYSQRHLVCLSFPPSLPASSVCAQRNRLVSDKLRPHNLHCLNNLTSYCFGGI